MLKAELHSHTSEDPKEEIITYSARQLIDICAARGYDVLAITLHDTLLWNDELKDYAKSKGILLIPGAEPRIEGKDILVYNVTHEDMKGILTIKDLYDLKQRRKDILIIAPHPYFIKKYCLGSLLVKHISLFDAIEYSHFYLPFINRNIKAQSVARRFHKPMVGTSDLHLLAQFGHTCTYIDAKKDVKSVLAAIRAGRVRVVTRPLPFRVFFRIFCWSMQDSIMRLLRLK